MTDLLRRVGLCLVRLYLPITLSFHLSHIQTPQTSPILDLHTGCHAADPLKCQNCEKRKIIFDQTYTYNKQIDTPLRS